ncbi:transporter substrate-binding domain-containing protein [Ampullimonas aquatilis]|uniref:transporter substrate-binding domain-containing protein n=1 Tax=Ampullimonas aquatilis TaxID=1341549 RepID=UPI003C75E265
MSLCLRLISVILFLCVILAQAHAEVVTNSNPLHHPHISLSPAVIPGGNIVPELVLNEDDRQFLAAHPVIRIAANRSGYPPLFSPTNEHAELAQGIAMDYLSLIAKRLNVQFKVGVQDSFEDSLNSVRDHNADMVVAAAQTSARTSYLTFTQPFIQADMALIVPRGQTVASPQSQLEDYVGKTFAIESGYAAGDYLRELFPSIKIKNYDTTEKALRAVASGEAEVYAGLFVTAHYQIEKFMISNLELAATFSLPSSRLGFAVRKDWPQLVSLMDRVISSMTQEERQQIESQWQPYFHFLQQANNKIRLTDEEQAYLKSIGSLTVGYDNAFAPFSAMAIDQNPQGMAFDYLKQIENRLGLPTSKLIGDTWSQVLQKLQRGEVHILIAAARSAEREHVMNFSGPYYSSPTVIVTHPRSAPVFELGDLAGKKLAVLRDHFYLEEIRRRFPAIEVVEMDDMATCMQSVVDHQTQATIGNMDVVDNLIRQKYLGQVQVAEIVRSAPSDLYFATAKDHPMLAQILNKAMDSFSSADHAAMRQKWMMATYESGLSWRKVGSVIVPVVVGMLLVLLISLFWNKRLSREVKRRQQVEQIVVNERDLATAQSSYRAQYIRTISHHVNAAVTSMRDTLELLKRHIDNHQPHGEPARLTDSLRTSVRALQQMLGNVLDYSRIESGKVTLNLKPGSLQELFFALADEYDVVARLKGLSFNFSVSPNLHDRVMMDAVRVRQLLTNLLSNATHFTQTGFVRFSIDQLDSNSDEAALAQPIEALQKAMLTHQKNNVMAATDNSMAPLSAYQWLRIMVEDSGPGISQAQQTELFHAYNILISNRQRAVPIQPKLDDEAVLSANGGLGLLICKELCELMGAQMQLFSHADDEVSNTLSDTAALTPDKRDVPIQSLVKKQGTIVVIILCVGLLDQDH